MNLLQIAREILNFKPMPMDIDRTYEAQQVTLINNPQIIADGYLKLKERELRLIKELRKHLIIESKTVYPEVTIIEHECKSCGSRWNPTVSPDIHSDSCILKE